MSVTSYPTLRLKLTMPQALKLQFLPAVPGTNAAAAAAEAIAAAEQAQTAADTAVAATADKVSKSGDVMSGFLTLNANPNTNLQAATKQYVDAHASGIQTINSQDGPAVTLVAGTNITIDSPAADQIRIAAGAAGISDAPSDGSLYGRFNATWAQAQPLDADLTSLAGASATGQWYYRSAANTWSPVTVGATMTFVGGVLNTTAGGGNVIATGTPLVGQWARWTSAATIEGVDAANTGFQPLDADLTAIAALGGTNTIYYRSAVDTWSAVNVSTGLAFSGGNLTSTVTSGAPVGAEYITSTADATLTAERVLTDTATVTWDRSVAGQIKANAAAGGGGASLTIADTPPASPTNGNLWWESDTGTLWLYYNDGTSSQWVAVNGAGSVGAVGPPQGRLSFATGIPVMTATTSSNQLCYVPYNGQSAPLYDGTKFVMTDLGGELNQLNTDATKSPTALVASKNYDCFLWDDVGTKRCTRGFAWTSDVLRGTGAGTTELETVGGFLVNKNSITNGAAAQRGTYVGTIRSTAANNLDFLVGSKAAGGGQAWIGVWNYYNRVDVDMMVQDAAVSWTYGVNGYSVLNGSNTWRVSFVSGLAADSWHARIESMISHSATGYGYLGLGLDGLPGGLTVPPVGHPGVSSSAQVISTNVLGYAEYAANTLGFHYVQAWSHSSGGVITFFGSSYGGMVFRWRY